jgi:hypothetical protein
MSSLPDVTGVYNLLQDSCVNTLLSKPIFCQ